jgi:hypothetical protein
MEQQDQNGLVGVGASASARPQPLPQGATDYPIDGAPTPTGTSAALPLSVQSGLVAFVAGLMGIILA